MLKVIVIREDDESVALMLVPEKVSWFKVVLLILALP